MIEHQMKIVRFDAYCSSCIHKDEDTDENPDSLCEECLRTPVNEYSKQPVNYRKNN